MFIIVSSYISALYWSSITYIVGVKACCVGSSCLDKTSFQALVDSGASFTFLPKEAYEGVVEEVYYVFIVLHDMNFTLSSVLCQSFFNSLTDN